MIKEITLQEFFDHMGFEMYRCHVTGGIRVRSKDDPDVDMIIDLFMSITKRLIQKR